MPNKYSESVLQKNSKTRKCSLNSIKQLYRSIEIIAQQTDGYADIMMQPTVILYSSKYKTNRFLYYIKYILYICIKITPCVTSTSVVQSKIGSDKAKCDKELLQQESTLVVWFIILRVMEYLQKIKNSIDPIVSLNDDELATFFSSFELKHIRKNEFFLKEGSICSYLGFLTKGTMIYYKPEANGNEITTDFAFEGDWVNSVISRLTNAPSVLNIRAIENSEVLIIQQKKLDELYLQLPKIERLGRIFTEEAFIKFVEQTIEFQTLTAKERYVQLLKHHPQIFQKVQLYHIANYLGIAPKSLSRIRKEIFEH